MTDTVIVSTIPQCDIHYHMLNTAGVPATVDGATKGGPWASMCDDCHADMGVGLGVGKGQRYIVSPPIDQPGACTEPNGRESVTLDDGTVVTEHDAMLRIMGDCPWCGAVA
jgi:hypothetical protein